MLNLMFELVWSDEFNLLRVWEKYLIKFSELKTPYCLTTLFSCYVRMLILRVLFVVVLNCITFSLKTWCFFYKLAYFSCFSVECILFLYGCVLGSQSSHRGYRIRQQEERIIQSRTHCCMSVMDNSACLHFIAENQTAMFTWPSSISSFILFNQLLSVLSFS